MLFVHLRLRPVITVHSSSLSPCNSYNILSIRLPNGVSQASIVVVYRPPDASAEQTIALFFDLHKLIDSSRCSVVMGDFNIIRDWSMPIVTCSDCVSCELSNIILDNDLIQLNMLPLRGEHILDLVLISLFLSNSDIFQLLSVSLVLITCYNCCVALCAPA